RARPRYKRLDRVPRSGDAVRLLLGAGRGGGSDGGRTAAPSRTRLQELTRCTIFVSPAFESCSPPGWRRRWRAPRPPSQLRVGRALAPGRYQVTVVAVDAQGLRSRTVRRSFVVRPAGR